MHYTIYSDSPLHKVFVDKFKSMETHFLVYYIKSGCSSSVLSSVLALWHDTSIAGCVHTSETLACLVFWLRDVDGETGESSDGSRSNTPRLLLMKLISRGAGSDWNPVFAGISHWLLSCWMIVLRLKTSTSPLDPFYMLWIAFQGKSRGIQKLVFIPLSDIVSEHTWIVLEENHMEFRRFRPICQIRFRI